MKIAGAGTAGAALAGYGVYRSADGETPFAASPYTPDERATISSLNGSAPVLLLLNSQSSNPFGAFLEEILLAEGLNSFHVAQVAEIDEGLLEPYDIVILAEGALNRQQIEIMEGFVFRGGRLLSMRPDPGLASLLGVESISGSLGEGYLKIEPGHPAAAGINTATLQFHGEASLFRLAGASPIAWLYQDRETAADLPAIAVNQYGGGMAALWAFDLAKSIAYTRQGNPAAANRDLDSLNGVRTVDMFVDWIDLDRISIPQADEQQRLLVNLLTVMSQGKRPLPRIWYFPEGKKTILVATGDSHMNPTAYVEDVLDTFDQYGGHMSVYYTPELVDDFGRAIRRAVFFFEDYVPGVKSLLGDKHSPTPAKVSEWRERGHEIGLHPYVEESLKAGWERYWEEFTGKGYGPVSATVRTHRVLWSGWVETARVQAAYGIRMNMDYYHVGPSLQKPNGEWVYGHLTGSGRPMKFIDENGRLLEIYQQLTQIADEHLLPMDVPGWGGWPGLSPGEAVEVAKYLFDRSINHGDYCAIGSQFHIDPFQVGGEPAEKAAQFLDGTLRYAQEQGIPIWSAEEWLEFTQLRHDSTMQEMVWEPDAGRLGFSLLSKNDRDLTLEIMVPLRHNGQEISIIQVDGADSPYQNRVVGGVEYACVHVASPSHQFMISYE